VKQLPEALRMPSERDVGVLVGLLIGEGHFGGDGRQAQVTLRMHVRHEALFRWIERTFPGGRLYGPYNHGGREYFQWMARGAYLRDELLPLLERSLADDLDDYAALRLRQMRERYSSSLRLSPPSVPAANEGDSAPSIETASETGGTSGDHVAPLDAIFDQLRGAPPA
jgi:hypothetical protein